MKRSATFDHRMNMVLWICMFWAGLVICSGAAVANELAVDIEDIVSRGHGAHKVGDMVYFVVDASKGEDRSKDAFLKVDDKLAHMVLDHTTRLLDHERAALQKHVAEPFFDDLLLAVKLERRRTPLIDTKQLWLSDDSWTGLYVAESRQVSSAREHFPLIDYDYSNKILLRLYYASGAWTKLTEYYWRNELFDDALRTAANSSQDLRRELSIAYPDFSADPVINAMTVLRFGKSAFERNDLLDLPDIFKMSGYERARRTLRIFATFSYVGSDEVNRRIDVMRRLNSGNAWKEFLDSTLQAVTNSFALEWTSISKELGGYVPLYTLRSGGVFRIADAVAPSGKVPNLSSSADPIRTLEHALVRVQSGHDEKVAWTALGDAMLSVRRKVEALAIYRVALSFEPGDMRIRTALASLYADLGYEKLKEAIRKSIGFHADITLSPVSLQ
jgi:predicted RNA-binding protein with TRAM domain